MTPQHTKPVSRRTALAGLGVSGIALAAGGRTVTAAQDATMADHPIVGSWQSDPNPAVPTLAWYAGFQADGTYTSIHTFAGPGIGAWKATGERTAEMILKYFNIAAEWGEFQAGTVTVWASIEVSADGNHFTEDAIVDFRGSDGSFIEQFPFTGTGTRLEISAPLPGTPEAATPAS